MLGISHNVLVVLCSLSIVMVLAIPLSTSPEKSTTRARVQNFIVTTVQDDDDDEDKPRTKMTEESAEGTQDETDELVERFLNGDFDQEADKGCDHLPYEHTTVGAGHPLSSLLALLLSNYLLVMYLQL